MGSIADPPVENGKLRGLGETEARFAQLHARYAGTGQVVVVLVVTRRLSKASLARAIQYLLARYQVLRARISVVGDEPCFMEPPAPPGAVSYLRITESESESESESWSHVERCVNTPLDATEGLWRVDALRTPAGAVLALAFHHAAVDGAGAKQVACALLASLVDEPSSSPSSEALPPPLDEALRVSDLARPSAPRGQLTFDVATPVSLRHTVSLRFGLESHETQALADFARGAKVGLHALLVAIFASSSAEAAKGLPLVVSTGLVLREIVANGQPNTGLGCWATEVTVELSAAGGLADLARQYERALLRASLKVVTRPPKWSERAIAADLKSEADSARFSRGLSLINMGAIDGRDATPIHSLSELWVLRNCSGGQHSLVVTVVEVHSRLRFTVCYSHPLVSHATAETIVMRVLGAVRELAARADGERVP